MCIRDRSSGVCWNGDRSISHCGAFHNTPNSPRAMNTASRPQTAVVSRGTQPNTVSATLVMTHAAGIWARAARVTLPTWLASCRAKAAPAPVDNCLLYTSDAADDLTRVDL